MAGVGWTLQDYLKFGGKNHCLPLPSGHRLYLHANRQVAICNAIAMAKEGDMVVSSQI